MVLKGAVWLEGAQSPVLDSRAPEEKNRAAQASLIGGGRRNWYSYSLGGSALSQQALLALFSDV